jgi:hypothetical protein
MSQDARDLRDPQQMGQDIMDLRKLYPEGLLSAVVDKFDLVLRATPLYPQDELLSTVTQREYREELQQAAKEGDKYAAERLRELQAL